MALTVKQLARLRRMSVNRTRELLESFPPGVVEEVAPDLWEITPEWRDLLTRALVLDERGQP
jgi:hypothetical protein